MESPVNPLKTLGKTYIGYWNYFFYLVEIMCVWSYIGPNQPFSNLETKQVEFAQPL